MDKFDIFSLAGPLIETAHKAGRVVMQVYDSQFEVKTKQDSSPVTEADQLAEDIILTDLAKLAPGIPVIAEEAASAGILPKTNKRFFLVDPLDGTKEFINRNEEFTVNIALIEQGVPVFGIVYAPAISMIYATSGAGKAIRAKLDVDNEKFDLAELDLQVLCTKPPKGPGQNVIASRSHMSEKTEAYLANIQVKSLINAGSSLKFCRLAEGAADLYPRFAPTMEWDTAAGHAILLAAGGVVLLDNGKKLCYGKREVGYLNPFFIAHGYADSTKPALSDSDTFSAFETLVTKAASVLASEREPDETVDAEQKSDQFAVYLVWKGDDPLISGRPYTFVHQNGQSVCSVSSLKYRFDPESGEHLAASTLNTHEIAYCNIELDQPIDFKSFHHDRSLGQFTLKDKLTGAEVAVGLIRFSLRRATNIHWQALEIDKAARSKAKQQTPHVLWFTGLSGSGKSTIASLLEKNMHAMGLHTYLLDGDNVRHGLCRDLGFTDADRVENIRRISEITHLFVDAGLIVIVSFISPFISERQMARSLFNEGEFIEIFVDTPLDICEERDPKGLYKSARAGKISNFTGLDSPYELPEDAEVVLKAGRESPENLVEQILKHLKQNGLIGS